MVVNEKLLKPDDYTDEKGFLRPINMQLVKCPVVSMAVDTPYYKGKVTG